jgi:hypothetical protein
VKVHKVYFEGKGAHRLVMPGAVFVNACEGVLLMEEAVGQQMRLMQLVRRVEQDWSGWGL